MNLVSIAVCSHLEESQLKAQSIGFTTPEVQFTLQGENHSVVEGPLRIITVIDLGLVNGKFVFVLLDKVI